MNELTSGSSTARPSGSPDRLVDRLFQRMAMIYGSTWADKWAGVPLTEVKRVWSASLHGLDPECVRLALDALVRAGKPFPPSLPEFAHLCRTFIRRGTHQLYLVDRTPRAGPPGGFQSLRDVLAKVAPKP